MSLFELSAVLITLTAAISWVNHRLLNLPQNVVLLVAGVVIALGLAGITGLSGQHLIAETVIDRIQEIDFSETVLHGMLAFLLFAGALQIDFHKLRSRAWGVAALATAGVALTALIVGAGLWSVALLADIPLSFAWAMVFGTLIAPTDPVAVLATLRAANPPETLEMDMAGEALFNDGIAVVLFSAALLFATGDQQPTILELGEMLAVEAGGGAALGLISGYIAYRAMHAIDDYPIEVMISLALAMSTYAIADILGTSGPIAVVVAGVLIGNRGAQYAMSDRTKRYVFGFWTLIDDILNALLFLLIGLEVLLLSFDPFLGLVATTSIPLALLARFVAIAAAVTALRTIIDFTPGTIPVLTWGSVRGGISIALALSIPTSESRSFILSATYNVVLFTIIVQGLTLGRLIRLVVRRGE